MTPCQRTHELRFEARPDRLGTRLWDRQHGCWMSAAHPNRQWMEELAVMLNIQAQVRDEIRTTRLVEAAQCARQEHGAA